MGSNLKVNGDVHHLDHFVIAVMQPDRAEKFYTEVMGARTLKSQNEPNMTRIFMKLGENHVGLFSQGKNVLPKRDSANSYPRHSFEVPAGEYDVDGGEDSRRQFVRARNKIRSWLGLLLERRIGLSRFRRQLHRDHQSQRHR